MSYLTRTTDPRAPYGDQQVSELVKIVDTVGTFQDHQTAINAFLLVLRGLPDHVAHVRSINTNVTKIAGPSIEQYTLIHYTLVGDLVLPVI